MKKETQKRLGRPPKHNPASVVIPPVRVTPDKLEAYKKAAEKEGLSFSAWVRGKLDKGL